MIKKLLPSTLFGRFTLIIFLPILILQASYVYIFYERHWDTLARRLAENLSSEMDMIYSLAQEKSLKGEQDLLLDQFQTALGIYVSYHPGEKVNQNTNPKKLERAEYLLYRSLQARWSKPFSVNDIDKQRNVEVIVQLNNGTLNMIASRKRLFSSTTYIFILWMVSLAGLFALLSIIFARNQIRPIRRLAVAAENFGRGRDIPGFRPQGALEVRQAAEAFNAMRERIQRQITQRTEMLAGVSHDLRTPLTRLKLQLALLPASKEIQDMQSDIDEMGKMIDAYLMFARGEGEEEKMIKQDLNTFLETQVTKLKNKNSVIEIDLRKKIMLKFRPQALVRCVSNIITNAQKFASVIKVSTKVREKMAHILIDDNGPGIPEKQIENVFKPFFRLDESRNLDHGGVGLGLTIARDIARGHGGDIVLEPSPLGGLRVVIKLPI